jgi:hypothetical protein
MTEMIEKTEKNGVFTDEMIGEQLAASVDQRVGNVLGPVFVPAFQKRLPRRAKFRIVAASLCALTVLGVGTQQGLQVAKDRKPKELIVAADTPAAKSAEPRMVLRSERYSLQDFQRQTPDPTMGERLMLKKGAITLWLNIIDKSHAEAINGQAFRTPITIGTHAGKLTKAKEYWDISWVDQEFGVSASGRGPLDDSVLPALGRIEIRPDKRFVRESLPEGFVVKSIQQPKGYTVSYSDLQPKQTWDNVSIAVWQAGDGGIAGGSIDFAIADGATVSKVIRGTRNYQVVSYRAKTSEDRDNGQVDWEQDGYTISVFAPGSADEALALAEQVQPATKNEWRAVVASSADVSSQSVVLKKGSIDDDVKTKFRFEADPLQEADCRTLALRWLDSELGSCVSDSSKDAVRMLKVTNVEGKPVVFGVLSNESPENQVVRVTDAEGDVVGEEVAYDQRLINGRAFAFPLDPQAVAPFKVELFDFDRAWYSENFDKPDTGFVSDEAEPTQTLPLNLESVATQKES